MGELYAKYTEDLEQLAESGKSLEESQIYKILQSLMGQRDRLIEFFTEKFTKLNTFDWDKMNITILHLVAFYAKDEAHTVLQLLRELVKTLLNTVDDASEILKI